jgi:uncharacterized membrane protein (UPF0127 family)
MKKTYICAFIALITFGFCHIPFATAIEMSVAFEREPIKIKTAKGEQEFIAEIASSDEQLDLGLMYRDKLAEKDVMLFVFGGKQKISMWMKNTLIPLDILFIDKTGKIVYIAENAKPNSLDVISAGDAQVFAVLEMNGGGVKKYHIAVGDKVISEVFE